MNPWLIINKNESSICSTCLAKRVKESYLITHKSRKILVQTQLAPI